MGLFFYMKKIFVQKNHDDFINKIKMKKKDEKKLLFVKFICIFGA